MPNPSIYTVHVRLKTTFQRNGDFVWSFWTLNWFLNNNWKKSCLFSFKKRSHLKLERDLEAHQNNTSLTESLDFWLPFFLECKQTKAVYSLSKSAVPKVYSFKICLNLHCVPFIWKKTCMWNIILRLQGRRNHFENGGPNI